MASSRTHNSSVQVDRLQAIPYDLELRDTIDSALYRLDELAGACGKCLELDDQIRATRTIDPQTFYEKTRQQTHVFDSLEAFLAAWARVSLLLFPTGKAEFTKRRGRTLRRILGVQDTSILGNRALRDSWMHFDERLDQGVSGEGVGGRQLFVRSTELTDNKKRTFLRVVEIDTQVVHYRDRKGQRRSVSLADLRGALVDLERRRNGALDKLPVSEARNAT